MNYRFLNNLFVIIIIICSTSLYSLSMLGSGTKIIELLGVGLIFVLLVLHIVYASQTKIRHNFTWLILFIFLSLITSMLMARFSRNQGFTETLFAQRAIYYYLFYFLLHQLKIKPEDLERIFIAFGLLHVFLYFVQFFLFPRIIFDVFMLSDRGTIRIYLKGSDYLAISYFMSIQAFLRTNKIKYLVLILLFFSIFILLGGRQTMAIMALTLILFIIFSKKVKSRLFIGFLVAVCISLVLVMFQGIFEALIKQSARDRSLGSDYIRFISARHFLTDFFRTPVAYITGNGMFSNNSNYGHEIRRLMMQGYFLGDIGLIGNYAIYGAFFVIGVIGICIKSLILRIKNNQIYIRYMFIAIILSLITGGGFVNSDFICATMCLLYLIDISHYTVTDKSEAATINKN